MDNRLGRIKQAVILAGGLGTRLQGVVSELPKPMAEVAGKPFLFYLLSCLKKYHVERVVLAVGYKYEMIEEYFGTSFNGMDICYAVEDEPLGTGGALLNALEFISDEDFFLLNGDSFFNIDLEEFGRFHYEQQAEMSLALKPMTHFDRYGTVALEKSRVLSFEEKKPLAKGLINAGVYVQRKHFLLSLSLPTKSSFEKDILEKYVEQNYFVGWVQDGYFIDIGIPADYFQAQEDFLQLNF